MTEIIVILIGFPIVAGCPWHAWRCWFYANLYAHWLDEHHPELRPSFAHRPLGISSAPYFISHLKIIKFIQSSEDFNDPEVKEMKKKMAYHNSCIWKYFSAFMALGILWFLLSLIFGSKLKLLSTVLR